MLEPSAVPVGPGATVDDALAGGDDYELCFTAPDPVRGGRGLRRRRPPPPGPHRRDHRPAARSSSRPPAAAPGRCRRAAGSTRSSEAPGGAHDRRDRLRRGSGIAADLKTFAAHGVWGTCAVTAVTAQNTVGVVAVEILPAAPS